MFRKIYLKYRQYIIKKAEQYKYEDLIDKRKQEILIKSQAEKDMKEYIARQDHTDLYGIKIPSFLIRYGDVAISPHPCGIDLEKLKNEYRNGSKA